MKGSTVNRPKTQEANQDTCMVVPRAQLGRLIQLLASVAARILVPKLYPAQALIRGFSECTRDSHHGTGDAAATWDDHTTSPRSSNQSCMICLPIQVNPGVADTQELKTSPAACQQARETGLEAEVGLRPRHSGQRCRGAGRMQAPHATWHSACLLLEGY